MLLAATSAALGCGGDDDGVALVADAGRDARVACLSSCNPLSARGMQGCSVGQKCAAVREAVGALTCAALACVSEGLQMIGETCTWLAPAGARPGYDDCVAGAVCASDGACRDVCGFSGGAQEACAEPLQCRAQAGLFENGGEPMYGVCAPPL